MAIPTNEKRRAPIREGRTIVGNNLEVPNDLQRIEKVLFEHFHAPDLQAARITLAAVAAHDLPGQPVWVMLVAPPGCMKTELLKGLEGWPGVHQVDTVTPRTFLSGQIQEPALQTEKQPTRKPPSLLHRIGERGIIVCLDFSTVLSMKADDKKIVLADLRRIYDGHLRKEFGTSGEPPEWRGRITFLVAATPEVDRHYSIFQTLGERFIQVRWPRFGEEAALKAMNQDQSRAHSDLRDATHTLLKNLPNTGIVVPVSIQRQIVKLAEFVVRARTHVPRDYRKEIIYVPEPEAPTRLGQQLCQLAKGLARLQHRAVVTEGDLADVWRVGVDCLSASRRSIMTELIGGKQADDLPRSSRSYAASDLTELGLLTDKRALSDVSVNLLTGAGLLSICSR